MYICYENSVSYIISLFHAIAADPQLRKHFTLHYGAWHLLDDTFIAAYKDAFKNTDRKPIIEFSPEVISNESRERIKGNASYNLDALLENCKTISTCMDDHVRIELFFSRYHPTENSESLLVKEIKAIYRLKHALYMDQEHCIRVCYDHLSRDVASLYWHEHHQGTAAFNDFLQQKQSIDERTRYPFPVDNLCFYTPKELTLNQLTDIEALAQSLEYIERYCHELFHILFRLTGTLWIDQLYSIIRRSFRPQGFAFDETEHTSLLGQLCETVVAHEQFKHIGFLGDLVDFSLKKQQAASCIKEAPEIFKPQTCFQLTPGSFSIHQHDYLDLLEFLSRLEEHNTTPLPYQRTIYLYTENDITALPHRAYRATFQYFEAGGTRAGFENKLAKEMDQETAGRFLGLMERLIHYGTLRPIEKK